VICSDLDAAVIFLPHSGKPAAPLIGRYVTSLEVVIVQSKQYPIFNRRVSMTALAKEGWILNPQGADIGQNWSARSERSAKAYV
jgi:DNA-binding transcriptional LysR family regulator